MVSAGKLIAVIAPALLPRLDGVAMTRALLVVERVELKAPGIEATE